MTPQPTQPGQEASTGDVDPRVPTERVAPAAPRGESPDLPSGQEGQDGPCQACGGKAA
jgi:hypothetical protein